LGEIGFEESNVKCFLIIWNRFQNTWFFCYRWYVLFIPHLRFGTVSVRKMVIGPKTNAVFWVNWYGEFYANSFNFPRVTHNFKPAYDGIQWRNNEADFKRWCSGTTTIPWLMQNAPTQWNRLYAQ
jgi:deoxyribodipyrimidine photo-lyase